MTLRLPPRTVCSRSADADAHMPVGGAVGAVHSTTTAVGESRGSESKEQAAGVATLSNPNDML
jgi:hypothetical protein